MYHRHTRCIDIVIKYNIVKMAFFLRRPAVAIYMNNIYIRKGVSLIIFTILGSNILYYRETRTGLEGSEAWLDYQVK